MASRSWNRVELIGNLTRDPELRYIPSGTAVASFGIATNRVYMTEGERREEVDFHKIVAWGKLAELCSQLLKKGSRVFVSGRLQYREWETADGQKRRDAEIVMEDMILLTPKSGMVEETLSVSDEIAGAAVPSKEENQPKTEDPKEEPQEKKEKDQPKANQPVTEEKAPKPDESVGDDLPF